MRKNTFKLVVVCCIYLFSVSCSNHSNQVDLKLLPVKSGEKWGYINPKGEYVINPQFKDACFFRDGVAKVITNEGKVVYIKEDGKYAIETPFKGGTEFSDGLAFVVEDGGYPTCIDPSGKTKFVLKEAKYVYGFSEGLARFSNNEGKYGFVDKSGKIVINPQFDEVLNFNEGFAILVQDGKCGFIDKTGKIVINPQFDSVFDFRNGKAGFKNGNQWGFIDTKGSYIINPQFDGVDPFSEGYSLFKQGSDCGYINEKGKIEINPQFDRAGSFKNGLAYVAQGNKNGYINKKGQFEINPQFEETSDFFGNFALVKNADKWGIIDKKGKYLVNPQFDAMKTEVETFGYSGPVTSDFYDTADFISKFFERAKGSDFDGFKAGSTLQNLLDNATYGNDVNANQEYAAFYNKSQKLTDEISINATAFNFSTPVFNGSYYNKEYNFSAGMSGIQYLFSLSGDAAQKRSAIAVALKSEFENRYKVQFVELPNGNDKILYSTYNEANKIYGVIYFYNDNVILSVAFQKDKGSLIADNQLFLEKNKSKKGVITTESGLQYEVLTAGKGAKPTATDKVKVHYTGTLIDGTEFDSSVTKGEPVIFALSQVIIGWTEALQLMPVGSKYRLYLPYDLAYGEKGNGDKIPAYSTLIFDVELLDINPAE